MSQFCTKYDPIAVASIDGSDTEPHDRAVVRALNSSYTPNKKLKSNASYTIFVSRLHPKVTDSELESIFSEYGDVKSCKVVRDIVTAMSKQYAFVEFEKSQHAMAAFRHAHKKIIRGAEILVDWEVGRTMPGWRPRRLGGGFGGKKEAGQLRFGCRGRPWAKPILPQKSYSSKR